MWAKMTLMLIAFWRLLVAVVVVSATRAISFWYVLHASR